MNMFHRSTLSVSQQFLLLAVIVTRIVCVFLPSFSIDMTAWQAWAARLAEVGPWQFYSSTIWTNYTPGYLIILWIFGLIYKTIGLSTAAISFELLIKLSTTVFDCAAALLIYKVAKKYQSAQLAIWGALLYLANPASIMNTSVWGQVDGILAFFLFLAIYFGYEVKQLTNSFLSYVFAILIKPQSIALSPLMVFTVLQSRSYTTVFKAIGISVAAYILVSVVFFPHDLLFGLIKLIIQMSKDYSFTSLYAFNFWDLVGWWQQDTILWQGISYTIWGYLLYATAIGGVSWFYYQKRHATPAAPYLAAALFVLAFFLFPTRVHERYLFPVFVFLLTSACLLRSRLLFICYGLLAAIHFLNLWFVYYYYMVLYNKPEVVPNSLYGLINEYHKILSILSLIIFGMIVIVFVKLKHHGHHKEAV